MFVVICELINSHKWQRGLRANLNSQKKIFHEVGHPTYYTNGMACPACVGGKRENQSRKKGSVAGEGESLANKLHRCGDGARGGGEAWESRTSVAEKSGEDAASDW
jgi:hypothetical protein